MKIRHNSARSSDVVKENPMSSEDLYTRTESIVLAQYRPLPAEVLLFLLCNSTRNQSTPHEKKKEKETERRDRAEDQEVTQPAEDKRQLDTKEVKPRESSLQKSHCLGHEAVDIKGSQAGSKKSPQVRQLHKKSGNDYEKSLNDKKKLYQLNTSRSQGIWDSSHHQQQQS